MDSSSGPRVSNFRCSTQSARFNASTNGGWECEGPGVSTAFHATAAQGVGASFRRE